MGEILKFHCSPIVISAIGYCFLLFEHWSKCGSLQLNAGNLATMLPPLCGGAQGNTVSFNKDVTVVGVDGSSSITIELLL